MRKIGVIGVAVCAALGLSVPMAAQAGERLIKITTLEPETIRSGDCGDPNDPVNFPPEFAFIPAELGGVGGSGEGQRGYTQECTPDDPADPFGPGEWELATNRWLPGTIVVNKGDVVTLEIFGIRGRDHDTQLFRPGYEIVIRPDGLEGVSGIGADNCIGDTMIGPNGQPCFFTSPRGEVTKITFTADEKGAWVLHCHTHGTAMNLDIIVVPTGKRSG